jgi:diguanylate cyclase (GGDEF)-like protein/PAS domain S-box-containing protein
MNNETNTDQHLRHLAEYLLDMVLEIDQSGTITSASPSSQRVWGYAAGELLGQSLVELIHPEDRGRVTRVLQLGLDPAQPQERIIRVEHRILVKDGHYTWVETIGNYLPDDYCNPAVMVLTVRDTTERYQADLLQKALYRISEAAHTSQDLQSLYRLVHEVVSGLFSARNLYIALYDAETETIQFPYYVDEYDPDIPEPDRKFPIKELEKGLTCYLLRSGEPVLIKQEDYSRLQSTGVIEPIGTPSVDWLGVPLKTAEGKTIGMLAVQTYTQGERYGNKEKTVLGFVSAQIAMAIDHKMTHDALKQSDERLHLAIEAAQIGLWDLNPVTNELVINEMLVDMLHLSSTYINLSDAGYMLTEHDRARLFEIFDLHLNAQSSGFSKEIKISTGNNCIKWLQMYGKISGFGVDGSPARITGTIQDVTDRHENEQKLHQRDAVLEAVSYAADKFLKTTDWEASIEDVLAHLGQAIGADRAYILHRQDEAESGVSGAFLEYLWVSGESLNFENHQGYRDLSGLFDAMGDWFDHLYENQIIQGRADDFPQEKQKLLKQLNVTSVIQVPIFAEQSYWGLIGFDSCNSERDLSNTSADVLRVAADILGAAVQNQATEESLRETEARQRAILNTQPDIIFLVNPEGIYLDCYTSNVNLLGMQPSEMIGHCLADELPEDVAEKWLAKIQKAIQTGAVEPYHYSMQRDQEERFFDARFAVCTQSSVLVMVRDITESRLAEEKLRLANEKLTVWVRELEQRNRQSLLLNRMGDMLQSCLSVDEAYQVVRQYCEQLFEHTSGSIFILNNSKNILELVTNWGLTQSGKPVFEPDACWALRRGRLHVVSEPGRGLRCQHLMGGKIDVDTKPYLCIPMIAQGDTLGMMHLITDDDEPIQRWESLATLVSEQVGMALSNLNLRQLLQNQSIRDGLTNLFNRRYMQETLERELSRAKRLNLPLTVAMADIDRFKSYNDTLGHEAGDQALQEIGALLMSSVRKDDVPCRYGGDELTVILPGASLDDAYARLEQFRLAVRRLRLCHSEETTGVVTVSLGLAGYPTHGATAKDLLRAADEALYQAKHQGRDQVVIKN